MARTVTEKIAEDTWQRMKYAQLFHVRLGEETLTDILALEWTRYSSKKSLPSRLFQTTKRDEAVRGTDLEIYVHVGNRRAIILAVQAKKLDKSTGRYLKLNANAGKNNGRQIDVLEKYARQIGAIPLYLLYNYVDSFNSQMTWHCRRQPDRTQMGCTLVPSCRIHDVLSWPRGRRNFDGIHIFADAVPWRCILDCPRGLDLSAPCVEEVEGYTGDRSLLAETKHAIEGRWPESIWERGDNSPLSLDELSILHGGHDVRLLNNAAMDYGESEPRLVPRRVLLINQQEVDE